MSVFIQTLMDGEMSFLLFCWQHVSQGSLLMEIADTWMHVCMNTPRCVCVCVKIVDQSTLWSTPRHFFPMLHLRTNLDVCHSADRSGVCELCAFKWKGHLSFTGSVCQLVHLHLPFDNICLSIHHLPLICGRVTREVIQVIKTSFSPVTSIAPLGGPWGVPMPAERGNFSSSSLVYHRGSTHLDGLMRAPQERVWEPKCPNQLSWSKLKTFAFHLKRPNQSFF